MMAETGHRMSGGRQRNTSSLCVCEGNCQLGHLSQPFYLQPERIAPIPLSNQTLQISAPESYSANTIKAEHII